MPGRPALCAGDAIAGRGRRRRLVPFPCPPAYERRASLHRSRTPRHLRAGREAAGGREPRRGREPRATHPPRAPGDRRRVGHRPGPHRRRRRGTGHRRAREADPRVPRRAHRSRADARVPRRGLGRGVGADGRRGPPDVRRRREHRADRADARVDGGQARDEEQRHGDAARARADRGRRHAGDAPAVRPRNDTRVRHCRVRSGRDVAHVLRAFHGRRGSGTDHPGCDHGGYGARLRRGGARMARLLERAAGGEVRRRARPARPHRAGHGDGAPTHGPVGHGTVGRRAPPRDTEPRLDLDALPDAEEDATPSGRTRTRS